MDNTTLPIQTTCCIAGGGPAGMMLGLLLARAGVDVMVLEKHADFLRDFRGDTLHPSTFRAMDELGLLDELLKRPHQELTELHAHIGNEEVTLADFRHMPTRCKFLGIMPQWEFLNFISEKAKSYPSFHLHMQTEALEALENNGKVVGVKAKSPQGEFNIRADVVIAADGRRSILRGQSGLEVISLGAPMDVLWMRLSRCPTDAADFMGRVQRGRMLVMINRQDYWQLGYVIPKGGYDQVRQAGLPALGENIAGLAPFLRDRIGELKAWDQVQQLTVVVDRLAVWFKSGFLCIGDAAHAMSPIGGVGINLAVQDAIATANILARPLLDGTLSTVDLHRVQKRRELPTRIIQRVQIIVQNRVISNVLKGDQPISMPFAMRLLKWLPYLRRFPARLVGMGYRPEHVTSPIGEISVPPAPAAQ